jgi:hypothetical protein
LIQFLNNQFLGEDTIEINKISNDKSNYSREFF